MLHHLMLHLHLRVLNGGNSYEDTQVVFLCMGGSFDSTEMVWGSKTDLNDTPVHVACFSPVLLKFTPFTLK